MHISYLHNGEATKKIYHLYHASLTSFSINNSFFSNLILQETCSGVLTDAFLCVKINSVDGCFCVEISLFPSGIKF
jgi:hypothetical protein